MTRQDAINLINKELAIITKELNRRFSKSLGAYVYSKPESQYYTPRTGNLRDAFKRAEIKMLPNGKITYRFLDYSVIKQRKGPKGQFNRHMSLDGSRSYDGTNIKYLVPLWVNDGFRLPNGGSVAPTHYIEKSFSDYDGSPIKFLEENFKNAVRKLLGIKK